MSQNYFLLSGVSQMFQGIDVPAFTGNRYVSSDSLWLFDGNMLS